MISKEKEYTFKEFKEFLDKRCFDGFKLLNRKYDRKIYNWFDLGKPKKVNFYKANGDLKKFINK